MSNFVLYHDNCLDGLGARYAAEKALNPDETFYIPVRRGEPIPQMVRYNTDAKVYIVDFSYSRAELEQLHSEVNKLVILDHHKTAQTQLDGLPYAKFDMTKSGAVMAWEYFNPTLAVPNVIKYVQDRDLWSWKLPLTGVVTGELSLFPYEDKVWEKVEKSITSGDPNLLIRGGAIQDFKNSSIESLIELVRFCKVQFIPYGTLPEYKVALVNSSLLKDELSDTLYTRFKDEVDLVAVYKIYPDFTVGLSLRSNKTVDCTKIAEPFGGGGHAGASGMLLTMEQFLKIFKPFN